MNSKPTRQQLIFVILVKRYSREQILDGIDAFFQKSLEEMIEGKYCPDENLSRKIVNNSTSFQNGQYFSWTRVFYRHGPSQRPNIKSEHYAFFLAGSSNTCISEAQRNFFLYEVNISSRVVTESGQVKGSFYMSTVLASPKPNQIMFGHKDQKI